MVYEVECPNEGCGCRLATKKDIRGKTATCPSCGYLFKVPNELPPLDDEPEPERSAPPRRSAGRSRDGQSGQRKRPARSEPRRRPPRRRPPARRPDDYYDDEEDEFDDGYDDEPYDDEPYDDDDDFGDVLSSARSRRAPKAGSNWAVVRIGLLVAGISACVFVGGLAFEGLSMAALNLSHMMAKVSQPDPEEVREMSWEERAKLYESRMDAMRSASSLIDTSRTMLKISQVILMVAVFGLLIGHLLGITAPNSNGAKAFAISALVLSIANLFLRIFYKLVPLLKDDGKFYDYWAVAATGGQLYRSESKAFAMMIDCLIPLEMLLAGLFLRAVVKTRKARTSDLCTTMMYLQIGVSAGMLVLYLVLFFAPSVNHVSMLYISWLVFHAVNVAWGVSLVMFARASFKSLKAL